MTPWHPTTWQTHPDPQRVSYDEIALGEVCRELASKAPLVSVAELRQLKQQLIEVHAGNAFILQAGDCAEQFADVFMGKVGPQAGLLRALAQQLSESIDRPTVLIGRIAGQYAKPRSQLYETHNGLSLPSYRGDMINDPEFSPQARLPRPDKLLQAYHAAKESLHHLNAPGLPLIFASHEALNLHYESCLTRWDAESAAYYDLSTHLPWAGMRTAFLKGAHIEYLRGLANPIALKVGPEMADEQLVGLIERLNPRREIGRLCLIHRLGISRIASRLPQLLQVVQRTQIPLLWLCDPMHGNTLKTAQGRKERRCADIAAEVQAAVRIHQSLGVRLNGLHLEVTASDVEECINSPHMRETSSLRQVCSEALMDPRLNARQASHLLDEVASVFAAHKTP